MAAVAALPPDMLANIHRCLSFLDRLAFAAVFRSSRDAFRPEAPCLVLLDDSPDAATLFSLAGRIAAATRAPGPDHHVLCSSSSRGWVVTADAYARMRLVNPVTGERRALPAIDTICLSVGEGRRHFTVDLKWFHRGPPPYPVGNLRFTPKAMRRFLYHKVVLSDSADIAMLITAPEYGVASFAMAGGGTWRLAHDGVEPVAMIEGGSWRLWHSRNGVEDAIHHNGRFYSITYSSKLEAWEERDVDAPGVFRSAVVAPSLLMLSANPDHRKYLMAAPCGRLMVALKEPTGNRTLPSFRVQVLGAGRKEWKETDDIGDAAMFVGTNSSLCMSTREHPELRAGCIYYTADGRVVVLSLKGGTVEQVEGLGRHRSWPPLEWFTPCIPRYIGR